MSQLRKYCFCVFETVLFQHTISYQQIKQNVSLKYLDDTNEISGFAVGYFLEGLLSLV